MGPALRLKYHKLGGLKQHTFVLLQFRGLESRGWHVWFLPGALGKNPSQTSFVASGASSRSLAYRCVIPVSASVKVDGCLFPLIMKTPAVGCRAHPNPYDLVLT